MNWKEVARKVADWLFPEPQRRPQPALRPVPVERRRPPFAR